VLKELFVDSYEDEDLFPPMDSVLSTPVKKLQSHYKSANHDPCSTLTQSALKSKDTRKDKLNFDAAFQSNDVTSDETVLNDMDVLPKPVKQFEIKSFEPFSTFANNDFCSTPIQSAPKSGDNCKKQLEFHSDEDIIKESTEKLPEMVTPVNDSGLEVGVDLEIFDSDAELSDFADDTVNPNVVDDAAVNQNVVDDDVVNQNVVDDSAVNQNVVDAMLLSIKMLLMMMFSIKM